MTQIFYSNVPEMAYRRRNLAILDYYWKDAKITFHSGDEGGIELLTYPPLGYAEGRQYNYRSIRLSDTLVENLANETIPWSDFPLVNPRVYPCAAQGGGKGYDEAPFILRCMAGKYPRRWYIR